MVAPSQDLQWLLVRKNSGYLVKQKGLGRIFSREPGNLKAIHSYKYSVLVNQKSVSIAPAGVSADQPAGRGVVVSTRKGKPAVNKIANTRNQHVIKKGGSRRTAGAVASIVGKRGYRADLLKGESLEEHEGAWRVAFGIFCVASQRQGQGRLIRALGRRTGDRQADEGAVARPLEICSLSRREEDVRLVAIQFAPSALPTSHRRRCSARY
ncbi:hypothetical protein IE81DRAFT_284795 [Ceraceosorus guamensis]|uniref:Ribosomal eL28/Mak16 domain-containing protein n=1 Tax=Ceraceosorus guamensis TaxID=1522189 RepID=A0A316W7C8_9BASI|nr:hypothetical protein IE81DRAFT_284795 [Ceraceosorus guamensis]PWN45846.1 hypothetical protein IE81DRAFT_284795 [Ceraceosorus guamensis]